MNLRLALTLLLGALLAACGGPGDAPEPRLEHNVVLRVGAPSKITNHALLEAAGELKDLPYRIEWSEFTSTPALLEAMRGGHIDFGGPGGTTGPIFEAANGGDLKIVAAAKATGAGGSAILVAKDSPLRSVAELRGKRISVVKGSAQFYELYLALKAEGMSLDDLQVLFLGNDMALASLLNGQIDAWVMWDPQTAVVQRQHGFRALAWLARQRQSYGIQMASPQALADPAKVAAIGDLLERISRARAWSNTHPEPLARITAEVARIDYPSALEAVTRGTADYVALDEQVAAELQREADTWFALGAVKRQIEVESLFERRFDARLAPHASAPAHAAQPSSTEQRDPPDAG